MLHFSRSQKNTEFGRVSEVSVSYGPDFASRGRPPVLETVNKRLPPCICRRMPRLFKNALFCLLFRPRHAGVSAQKLRKSYRDHEERPNFRAYFESNRTRPTICIFLK